MQWSRESRQTAAAVVVLAFGLALLAAPSLLTRNTNAQEVPAAAHGQASSTRDQGECLLLQLRRSSCWTAIAVTRERWRRPM